MLTIARVCLLTALLCASGCAGDRAAPSATVAQWELDSVPMLEIGSRDGPLETQFSRVGRIARLRDSSLAVVDGGTPAVRVFSARGEYVRTIGQRGDGPGEYRNPLWVAASDSGDLYVYDNYGEGIGRLIRYDTAGAPVWSESIASLPDASPSWPLQLLDDHTILFTGPVRETYTRRTDGVSVQGTDGVVAWRRGEPPVTIWRGPGQVLGAGPVAWLNNGMVVASDSFIYSAKPNRYAIGVHALDGSPRDSIVRGDYPVQRTTPDRIERLREEAQVFFDRIADPNRRRDAEESFANTIFPDTFPIIERMLTDHMGRLWVRLLEEPRWSVYTPSGTHIADLQPHDPRFALRVIEDDLAIGVWRDDDDVPFVRVYRIHQR